MLLDSCLVDDDLVAVVQDVDGVVAHDELGRLLLLEQQRRRRVFVTLGGSSFLLLGVDLLIFNKKQNLLRRAFRENTATIVKDEVLQDLN